MQVLQTAALLLLQRCSPTVATAMMASVVNRESSWREFAIADATTGQRYYPDSLAAAVALSNGLLSRGHKIAVGLSGVFSDNFAVYGLTAETALDRCVNLAVGSDILYNDYFGRKHPVAAGDAISDSCRITLRREPDGAFYCHSGGALDRFGARYALSAALQAYNSGTYTGSPTYAAQVIASAQQIVVQLPPAPDLALSETAAPPRPMINVTPKPQVVVTPKPRPTAPPTLMQIFHGATPSPRRTRP